MRPVISCDAPVAAAAAPRLLLLSSCSRTAAVELLLDERSSLVVLPPVKDADDSLPPSGTRGGRFLDLTGSMVFGAPSCGNIQGVQ